MRILIFFLALLLPSFVLGQEIVTGADTAGRAGAGVAIPENDAAIFINPAGASLTKSLVTGFLYRFFPGEGHIFSLLAVDGTSPKIDGGLSSTIQLADKIVLFEERSIASIPLGSRSAVGISQTLLFRPNDEQGKKTFLSSDVGLVIGLSEKFAIGATISNLPNARAEDRRRILQSGIAFGLGPISLLGEAGIDLTPEEPRNLLARTALEWKNLGPFSLRGGYVFDAMGTEIPEEFRQAASIGFSYHDERSTLDIAYEQKLAGEGPSRLTVAIRFFLRGMNPPPAPTQRNTRSF